MTVPERIWAWSRDPATEHYFRQWEPHMCHWAGKDVTEFIRADRLEALIAEARKDEREKAARMADRVHGEEMISLGRDPEKYSGRFSRLAAAIRSQP